MKKEWPSAQKSIFYLFTHISISKQFWVVAVATATVRPHPQELNWASRNFLSIWRWWIDKSKCYCFFSFFSGWSALDTWLVAWTYSRGRQVKPPFSGWKTEMGSSGKCEKHQGNCGEGESQESGSMQFFKNIWIHLWSMHAYDLKYIYNFHWI